MRSVRWKVFIPILVLILAYTVILSTITSNMIRRQVLDQYEQFSESYLDEIYNQVEQFHQTTIMISDLKRAETERRLDHLVDEGLSILAEFHRRESQGLLTRAQAQQQALDVLRSIRYGIDGYFWADTTDHICMLLAANPAAEGSDRYNLQDVNGQYIVRDMVAGAVKNGRFAYEYYFPKPGESEPSPKLGVVKLFEPWEWVLGTGEYVDNIDEELAGYEEQQLAMLNESLYTNQLLGSYPFIKTRDNVYIAYVNQERIGSVSPSFDKVTGEDLTAKYFEIGNGQIEYMWTKSGEPEDKFFKKIGYIRHFEARDWIIVFSSYEDNLIAEGDKVRNVIFVTGSILALAISLVALFIINLVTRALKIASLRLEEIAEGDADLTQRLSVRTNDETGRLAEGFNSFVESLRGIMMSVKKTTEKGRSVAETLSANVEEITATLDEIQATVVSIDGQSEDLSALADSAKDEIRAVSGEVAKVNGQAEDEAAAVEESSAAVEQMVASIQNISNIARDRVKLADTLSSVARAGEEQMETTLSDIDGIASSADAISEVVDVIDAISSQINLLAMNAAIEAAHAGDAGRGFAVVADEIRKLAESTGENSKRIGGSVSEIVERIGGTSQRSRKTGESITQIAIDSASVSAALTEILNALQELGRGTDQITSALQSLVGASAAVKESTEAIEGRSNQTNSTLDNVADLARQNHDAITEIKTAMGDIGKALAEITELGGQNAESLDELDLEVGRFTV